jgi:hypothetical protein
MRISAEYANDYEKKVWTVMVNNSTNINKTNNLSAQTTEYKIKDHDILLWKSWDRYNNVVGINQSMESQPRSNN